MATGQLMVRRFSLELEDYSGRDINSISDSIGKALHLWEGFGRVSEWQHLQHQSRRYQKMHLMSPLSGSSESTPRAKRTANSEQALASFWHCCSIVSGVSGMADVSFLRDLVETS